MGPGAGPRSRPGHAATKLFVSVEPERPIRKADCSMFRQVKGLATTGRWKAMMSKCRIFVIASLCAVLSGPFLWAQRSDSGPALGVARISLARSDVAVQRGESGDSIQARANLPLVEGDYLTTGPGSRRKFSWTTRICFDSTSTPRSGWPPWAIGPSSFRLSVERSPTVNCVAEMRMWTSKLHW